MSDIEIHSAPEVELASVFDRVFAFIIDYLPALLIAQVAVLVLFKMNIVTTLTQAIVVIGIVHLLFIIYEVIFTSGGRRTLGKYLMGIRVMGEENPELNILQAFMRVIGYYIGIFLLLIPFALAIFNKKRKALQDYMAGSIVISDRQKGTAESVIVSMLGTILIFAAAGSQYYLLKMPVVSDQQWVNRANTQLEKIAFLEDVHFKTYKTYTTNLERLGLISGDPVQYQRDMQRNLRRKGFIIGVTKNSYKIEAVAKDSKNTIVSYDSSDRKK